MLSLRPNFILQTPVAVGTAWLLGSCLEARGKQDLWLRQRPEVLKTLREQAIIQSTESSNRIEGVEIAPERLRPVALGASRPRDRSEEEIAGYRRALDWIFKQKKKLLPDARVIRHLHALAQAGSGDAGEFKKRDNEIIEILPNGARRVRFKPASAGDTPALIHELCRTYGELLEMPNVPPLLSAATFVFDFLCIHPFRDGNGRVSRLLTTLLLEQQGFVVSRYISLERLTEIDKESYYRALGECSAEWHTGKNRIVPWWNFLLGTLKRAYQEFESQVEAPVARLTKSDWVRRMILAQPVGFTFAALSAQCPGASGALIRKVLNAMKKRGELTLQGRGAGAEWRVADGQQ